MRVQLGRSLLIAGVCALIPLAGNVVAAFVTEWTGVASWLAVPVVAVLVAMVSELVQAYRTPSGGGPSHGGDGWPDSEPRGTPLPVAVLIAVVVLGAGGLAVAAGVRYGVGYITGNEPGVERLVRRVEGSAGGLTLTVDSVEHTAHFTRVGLAARNGSGIPLTLPLFGNCNFVGRDGTTLEADPFRSRWPDGLPPGALQRGTVTFPGHLPDRIRRASLSFTTIFWQGSNDARSIEVDDIRLRRPE